MSTRDLFGRNLIKNEVDVKSVQNDPPLAAPPHTDVKPVQNDSPSPPRPTPTGACLR
jgi:hypothetical protein